MQRQRILYERKQKGKLQRDKGYSRRNRETIMTAERFVEVYSHYVRDFSPRSDSNRHVVSFAERGEDLTPYIDFINSRYHNPKTSEEYNPRKSLNLADCELRGVIAPGLKIPRANLRNANLLGSDLRNCDFSKADLSFADLSWCDLSDCRVQDAIMVGTDLTNSLIPQFRGKPKVFQQIAGLKQIAKTIEEWEEMKRELQNGNRLQTQYKCLGK